MLTTRVLLRPLFRTFTNANKPNKDFDFSAFEEEIRAQRARMRNDKAFHQHQESGGSASDSKAAGSGPSKISLSPLVAKDLQLLNVPKYVSRDELKKQYHKLAKIYHPDIVQSKNQKSSQHLLSEQQKGRLDERFKEFKQAYDRLLKWVEERDQTLNDDLANNRRPGLRVNKEDGTVTYTFGKLEIEGKRSAMDKQQILLQMIEDDLNLKEPVNLRRNMIIVWAIIGTWVFYKEWRDFYKKMSLPVEGIDYDSYFRFKLIKVQ